MVLNEQNPSTVSEISKRAVMKLSTMTKVAQRLEKEGYVELEPNAQDRRATDVHLLEKGEDAVDTIRRVGSSVYRRATDELSETELQTLAALLTKLADNLLVAG